MKTFVVRWEIEVDAESATEAADEALRIQRAVESLATVFEVFECDGDALGAPTLVDAWIGETLEEGPI